MEQLLYKMDGEGDDEISYQEFLKYFGKGGAEDKDVTKKVRQAPFVDCFDCFDCFDLTLASDSDSEICLLS